MEENPYQPPTTDPASEKKRAPQPGTLWEAAKLGAWLGWKWVLLLLGPVLLLFDLSIVAGYIAIASQTGIEGFLRDPRVFRGGQMLLGTPIFLVLTMLWSTLVTVPISLAVYFFRRRRSSGGG